MLGVRAALASRYPVKAQVPAATETPNSALIVGSAGTTEVIEMENVAEAKTRAARARAGLGCANSAAPPVSVRIPA